MPVRCYKRLKPAMPRRPDIDIRPDHWEIVRSLLEKHVPQYAVWAFGSRAKWTAKDYSDLDLAVITDKPLTLSVSSSLSDDFSESDLPWKVDLVDWETTSDSFRKIIAEDYVVVQAAASGRNLGTTSGSIVLPLEDCLDALIDYRGKTPVKADSGIPLITAKIIKGGRIETPTEFIAKDDYVGWMRRGIPEEGDVVLTVEAPLGEVAQLGSEKIALAQRVVTLRGKAGLLDSTYLLYLLQTAEMQSQLKSRATGTTVLGIKQSELRKVTLRLPPLDLQLSAAATLKALDDRITLLRETNATLEAIAQALFKSWFVDFDPVRAKLEGRAPEGMDEATAALFPDGFEESELGLVPTGWRVKPLDEVANFLNGLALQKFPPTDDSWLPVIKIAQLRKGDTVGADRAGRGLKPDYIIQNGDVLFSWSGSLEVEVWCGGEGALNQHLFKVTSNKYPKWFYYLWTKHHLEYFRQIAASKATTMGHIQRAHLTHAKVVVPPDAFVEAVGESFSPLLDRWIATALQAQTLATLRDTLLPRLISGQLRLPEAMTKLEESCA